MVGERTTRTSPASNRCGRDPSAVIHPPPLREGMMDSGALSSTDNDQGRPMTTRSRNASRAWGWARKSSNRSIRLSLSG